MNPNLSPRGSSELWARWYGNHVTKGHKPNLPYVSHDVSKEKVSFLGQVNAETTAAPASTDEEGLHNDAHNDAPQAL